MAALQNECGQRNRFSDALKCLLHFDLLMAALTALFFSLIILVLLSLLGAASWAEVLQHLTSAQGAAPFY